MHLRCSCVTAALQLQLRCRCVAIMRYTYALHLCAAIKCYVPTLDCCQHLLGTKLSGREGLSVKTNPTRPGRICYGKSPSGQLIKPPRTTPPRLPLSPLGDHPAHHQWSVGGPNLHPATSSWSSSAIPRWYYTTISKRKPQPGSQAGLCNPRQTQPPPYSRYLAICSERGGPRLSFKGHGESNMSECRLKRRGLETTLLRP